MKIILVITIFLCCLQLNYYCQIKTYGIKFGVNRSSLTGTSIKEPRFRNGAIASIYSDYSLYPKLLLQSEIVFVENGLETKNYDLFLDYLEIPLLVKTNLFNMEFYTGASYGLLLSSQYNYYRPFENKDPKMSFSQNNIDLKFGVASNLKFGSQLFTMEIRYNLGIKKISNGALNNSLSFMLGIGESNIYSLSNKSKLDSIKKEVLQEIKYLMNSNEIKHLLSLEKEEEVNQFADNFWKEKDPTPLTEENEFKEIYHERMKITDRLFSEINKTGSQTDRGRVFILYGPPDEIHQENMIKDYNPLNIRSYEIWIYNKPEGGSGLNNIFSDVFPGRMRFVFADLHGYGVYDQIFSTELTERTDPKTYLPR